MPTSIRLVVADLAGTTIDFGSSEPAGVFVDLFARHGVAITIAEARGPMGTAKRDHIAAVAALPRITATWEAAHGRPFREADLDTLYADFIPLQLESLPRFDDLIPGTREAVAMLRNRGIAIAVTTGYDAAMMAVVLAAAGRQGFVPDTAVCAAEVAVGDTLADIEAARNAGAWAVGVTATGNMLGLTRPEHDALAPGHRADLLKAAAEQMHAAGAHAVIEGIGDLPAILSGFEAEA
ncbi:MAG: phosphonoacetaldehyde hydrolase [Planctomycetota bacterium]|nr:MAG: phosphonoacetaldehyde hydrolase [Planctomycetota bacterium]